MTYTVPPTRLGAIHDVLGALEDARSVVLTTHLNADGDGAGSEVALAAFLRERGTKAWLVNPTPYPRMYRFLLPDDGWVLPVSEKEAIRRCAQADLAVVLDTGENQRIGRVKPLFDQLPRVVIDHHPAGPDPIEGVSFRDSEACATGELVFDLIHEGGGPWPAAAVMGLYVAILTDTGSFRHSNTTARCHQIVADLIQRGIDPEDVHRKVYGALPLRRIQLLKASLEELEVDVDGRVAWMTVPHEAYRTLGAGPDDLEGLVDYPRAVDGVQVALLFRRIQGGDTKVSFRSNGSVDVNALARTFGGGGHVRASGALVKGPVDEVKHVVIDATRRAVQDAGVVGNGTAIEEPSRTE
jgi:phosphoesterase RecJ-like protein